MKTLGYTIEPSKETVAINCSDGHSVDSADLADLLEFLYYSGGKDYLNICWDLDSTIAPLLKLLGKELCIKLHKTNKCFYRPYSIFYIPAKLLSIKTVFSKDKANYYDISQYFPDKEPPEGIEEVARLGEELLEALGKMGLQPNKLTSPVAIWEQQVMNHLNLPTAWDMPKEAAEFAWRCSGKLWIEAYTIGFWDKAYDFDIIASFPSIARNLIDIRHCNWVGSKSYISEAIYGYVKCAVTIYDWVQVSPIIYETEDGSLLTPTGTWETYLTKGELDFIDKWEIGEYKIIDGWWAIPKVVTKPLRIVMDRLLAYKESSNELVRLLAKRMSVGVYGKFGEEHKEEFGRHFNPVWFAEISTQVRLKVAQFIYERKLQESLVHVSVDGVLLSEPVGGINK